MNRGKKSLIPVVGGYTIVEVLIFLAVSGVMFFAAMTYVGGRQNKAQFLNAVRDFESKIGDIANDVTTGYYTRPVDFSCRNNSGTPTITNTATDQGTNGECIFVGTAIKFGDGSGNRDSFLQFAMAGVRQTGSGQDVRDLAQANPEPISLPGAVQKHAISYGASVRCINVDSDSCVPTSSVKAAIGFFTTFGGVSPSGQGSSIQADMVSYGTVNYNHALAATISALRVTPVTDPPLKNIVICLQSGGTKQYALIKIGGTNSGSSAITTEIKGYSGSTPSCN